MLSGPCRITAAARVVLAQRVTQRDTRKLPPVPNTRYQAPLSSFLLPPPPGHHGGLYFIPDIRYPELVSALLGIN